MKYLSKYNGFKNILEDLDMFDEENIKFFNISKDDLQDYLTSLSDQLYVRVLPYDGYISINIHNSSDKHRKDIDSLISKIESHNMSVEEKFLSGKRVSGGAQVSHNVINLKIEDK